MAFPNHFDKSPVTSETANLTMPDVRITGEVPLESGGPDRTRICDLYRVKVLRSIACDLPSMKTRELEAMSLDFKWTAEPLLADFGPHTDLHINGPIFFLEAHVLSRVVDTAY
jgi:hypothetical protein